MIKAFVFGKFLPFHKGHEGMMRFALTKCDMLTVLVCSSDNEQIPGTLRQSWIQQTFEKDQPVQVQLFEYNESELPNSSESSMAISAIWAEVFSKLLPGHKLLITSEPYGDYLAHYMNIRHLSFDQDKTRFPFSASSIRNDIFTNWKFLPAGVKQYYAIRVVILGTESTGKTTLTQKLSAYFDCTKVSEAGRDLIKDSNDFSFEDLEKVAAEHAARIDAAAAADHPLLIIDTDVNITQSYSKFMFGKVLAVSDAILQSNRAHLYLYFNNDVEYVQDGTRLSEADRNLLDLSHRQVLSENNVHCIEITGDWNTRFHEAVNQVNQLITSMKSLHRGGVYICR